MKSMTCRDLGGACNKILRGSTFEEIADSSREHGMDMYKKGDKEHMAAMEKMSSLMQDQQAMSEWMAKKRALFDSLPDDN